MHGLPEREITRRADRRQEGTGAECHTRHLQIADLCRKHRTYHIRTGDTGQLQRALGHISLNDAAIENWKMMPLLVKEASIEGLTFGSNKEGESPCFHKGTFEIVTPKTAIST